jgi:hypothetical protein
MIIHFKWLSARIVRPTAHLKVQLTEFNIAGRRRINT